MTADLKQLLLEKQGEIIRIVLAHPMISYYYGQRGVRIFGCPYDSDELPAVDVLINFDEPDEQYKVCAILCLRERPSLPDGKPQLPPRSEEWYFFLTLTELLGCTVNVCNERGLQTGYPVTYAKTLESHKWAPKIPAPP